MAKDFYIKETEVINGTEVSVSKKIADIKDEFKSIIDIPSTIVQVNSLTDLPAAAGGKIALAASTMYCINSPINIGTDYIELSAGSVLIGISAFLSQIIYTGTGGAVRGTDIDISLGRLTFVATNGSGKVFDCINNDKTKNFVLKDCIIANSTEVGSVTGFDTIAIDFINHTGNSDGWEFSNTRHLIFLDCKFDQTNTGTFIDVPSGTFETMVLSRSHFHAVSGVVAIDIDEGTITIEEQMILSSNSVTTEGTGIAYQNFQPLNGKFESHSNTGIPNKTELAGVDSTTLFQITSPTVGESVYITDLLSIATWNGTYWEHPDGTQVLKTGFTEDFETGSFTDNGWVTVNGGENDWHVGTAAKNEGTYGAYVSNDSGSTNAYTSIGGALDVSHVYIDIALPNATSDLILEFYWRCEGEVNYDATQIFNKPTSFTPVANSEVVGDLIGLGQYNDQSVWKKEQIALDLAQAGTTRRFIFSWRNDSSVENQPPMAIDNVKILWL